MIRCSLSGRQAVFAIVVWCVLLPSSFGFHNAPPTFSRALAGHRRHGPISSPVQRRRHEVAAPPTGAEPLPAAARAAFLDPAVASAAVAGPAASAADLLHLLFPAALVKAAAKLAVGALVGGWLAMKTSLASFLAGGFGGACLVLVGHPLDLIKVKLQSMEVKPGEEPPYRGMVDCAMKTIQQDGPLGLYRGLSAPLLGIAPVFAVCFWGYDLGETLVRMVFGKPEGAALSLFEVALAGGFSAIPTTLLMTPMERVKCLLQVQQSRPAEAAEEGGGGGGGGGGEREQYAGMLDCARKLVAAGGLGSLFLGLGATLVRDIPASVAYFYVYAALKGAWAAKGGQAAILAAGGFAGIANWLVCIPPDTVKTKLQTAPEGRYSNYFEVWSDVLRSAGFLGLYAGIVPVLIRAFPANAACFYGMEAAKTALAAVGL